MREKKKHATIFSTAIRISPCARTFVPMEGRSGTGHGALLRSQSEAQRAEVVSSAHEQQSWAWLLSWTHPPRLQRRERRKRRVMASKTATRRRTAAQWGGDTTEGELFTHTIQHHCGRWGPQIEHARFNMLGGVCSRRASEGHCEGCVVNCHCVHTTGHGAITIAVACRVRLLP